MLRKGGLNVENREKQKKGLVGLLLIKLEEGWNVVSEDGSYERYSACDIEIIGEVAAIVIPSSRTTLSTQREIIMAALKAIGDFKNKGA